MASHTHQINDIAAHAIINDDELEEILNAE